MKLIVAGSTGFVATEVIRQAIANPAITSIIALARRETAIPQNAGSNTSKFKSVVCEDFSSYPENVKKELAGANACIWLLAVTPSKAKAMPFNEARKICLDYTVTGIETISPIASKPFRFIYTSGAAAERDQTRKPWILGDYSLMRGEAESYILNYAQASKGSVEAAVAKPGLIDAPGKSSFVGGIFKSVACSVIGLPQIDNSQVAATLIDQVVNGFEKDTLLNQDLARIGSKVLLADQKSSS